MTEWIFGKSSEDKKEKFPCPCDLSLVFLGPADGNYSICPICMWEDDPVQADDHDYAGGENRMSLNQARSEFFAKQRTNIEQASEMPRSVQTSPIPDLSE